MRRTNFASSEWSFPLFRGNRFDCTEGALRAALQPPLQIRRNFAAPDATKVVPDREQVCPEAAGERKLPLELRFLGGFSLRVLGQEVAGLPGAAKWLLALLVLRRRSTVEREWLAGTLWPEATQ